MVVKELIEKLEKVRDKKKTIVISANGVFTEIFNINNKNSESIYLIAPSEERSITVKELIEKLRRYKENKMVSIILEGHSVSANEVNLYKAYGNEYIKIS